MIEVRARIYRHLFLPSIQFDLEDELFLFDRPDVVGILHDPDDDEKLAASHGTKTNIENGSVRERAKWRGPARYPAILRACQAIYTEAAALLYSELTITVGLNIIRCWEHPIKSEEPNIGVWRHDPLYGVGHRQHNGGQLYNTPELPGFLDPHVFARF